MLQGGDVPASMSTTRVSVHTEIRMVAESHYCSPCPPQPASWVTLWPPSITVSNFHMLGSFSPLVFQAWAVWKLVLFLLNLIESWETCCWLLCDISFKICACSIHVFRWCFTQDNNQNPSSVVWDTGGTHKEGLACIMQICCRNSVSLRTLISTIFENRSTCYIVGKRRSNPGFQDWGSLEGREQSLNISKI